MPDGLCDGAQVSGNPRILRGQFIDVADLDVGGNDSRPFGARAEKPAAPAHHPRRMEGVAGDEELDALPTAQIRPTMTRSLAPSLRNKNTSSGSPR